MPSAIKKRSWKRVALIAGVLVLVGLGVWYAKFRRDSAPQYQSFEVTSGDLTQVVTAAGQLNPVTNVTVGCQISGPIAKLYVDWNSPVTNGQIVALIDPAIYKANLHSAEATVEIKRAALELAKVNLNYCTIYSPVDGMVISRNVDVGQTVAASLNAPTLFVIANDLTKMQIDADVAESDIGGVEERQKTDFTVDAFPNRTFHGLVVQVRNSPITVQNVVTYDTVIGVSNPDLKLKPGMTANVSIIVAERSNVLKIPNAALRFRPAESTTNAPPGGATAGGGPPAGNAPPGQHPKGQHRPTRPIYVLKDGKLEPVQVKIGIT